jgi:hypothetical protein
MLLYVRSPCFHFSANKTSQIFGASIPAFDFYPSTEQESSPPESSNATPYLQNNQRKMDWSCGSSSREPALQM